MNDLDALIEELKKDPITKPEDKTNITEDTVHDFVIEKAAKLVNSGLASVEEVAQAVKQSIDPEELEGYASLINATTSALEALNKIGLQKKRLQNALKIKELDIEGRKGLPQGGNTTNVLIATREEIINKVLANVQKSLPVQEAEILENCQ